MKNRHLLRARLALTPICNFRCLHCYVGADYPNKTGQPALTTSEIREILTELAQSGCLFVSFTGGEPLLHPDFSSLWEFAFRLGLRLNLFTNGSLIDKGYEQLFRKYPPRSIQVSLYGHYPETYRRFTGSAEIAAKVSHGVQRLSLASIRVIARYIISTATVSEAVESKKFYSQIPGITWIPHPVLDPCMSGCHTAPEKTRVSVAEAVSLLLQDPYTRERLLADFRRRNVPRSTLWYHCSACENSISIDPFGGYSFCDYALDDLSLNVRDVDLTTGFFKVIPQWISSQNERHRKPQQCVGCDARVFCLSCPQTAKLESPTNEINRYYHEFAMALRDSISGYDDHYEQ